MMKEKKYLILIVSMTLFFGCTFDRQEKTTSGIVSVVPSLTDFACLVHPNKILGVSNYCDAICLDSSVEIVSGFDFMDYEKILALNPDKVYVLEGFSSSAHIKRLNELGIEVSFFKDHTVQDVLNIPELMDSVSGKIIKDSLTDVFVNLKKNKVNGAPSFLIVIANEPLQAYGKGNYLDDLCTQLGFVNKAKALEGSYPILGSEFFIKNIPDIIISADTILTKKMLNRKYKDILINNELADVLMIQMDASDMSRSGPNFLNNGVTILNKWDK